MEIYEMYSGTSKIYQAACRNLRETMSKNGIEKWKPFKQESAFLHKKTCGIEAGGG